MRAPALFAFEIANALAKEVRAGSVTAAIAFERLRALLDLPLELVPGEALAEAALESALDLGLTAYDAAYVVLAEAHEALLVTADRRLAEAYRRAELVV